MHPPTRSARDVPRRRAAEPTTSAMAALADLQAALSARNVEDAVRIFTEMQAAGAIDADTRALAADGATEFLFVLGVPRFVGAVQAVINPIAIR